MRERERLEEGEREGGMREDRDRVKYKDREGESREWYRENTYNL